MHEQIDLVPNAFARSGPAQARHASRKGAESAANRAENQTARYLALLQEHPEGLTDWQAAQLLSTPTRKIERTSINARRAPLSSCDPPVVVANGFVKDEHSEVPNTRWQLASLRKVSAAVESDRTKQPVASLREDSVRAGYDQQGIASDAGNVAKPDRDADSASCASDIPQRSSSASILTAETAATVAFNTRVRFADGSFGQFRMLMRNGDLAVYVFDLRETVYLKPSTLIDRRESDGELVEVSK